MMSRENFVVERQGINYVRSIIENADCRFTEIPKDNDFGIDAIVDVVYKRKTTGDMFSLQIKSGESYCSNDYCRINAPKKHQKYWKKHPLPVFGIVYDPSERMGYWTDIKKELEGIEKNSIKIVKSTTTKFTKKSFKNWITPKSDKVKEKQMLSFEESVKLAESNDLVNIHVGMSSLAQNYENEWKTWETILKYFKSTTPKNIPHGIVYVLSAVPGHHGMYGYPIVSDKEIKNKVLEQFSKFTKKDVIKLLYPIDEYAEESGEFFPRGNTSHCAAVVISFINNKNKILKSIVYDEKQNAKVRKYALVILAMNLQEKIKPILNDKLLHIPKSEQAIEYLTEWIKEKPRYELFSQW